MGTTKSTGQNTTTNDNTENYFTRKDLEREIQIRRYMKARHKWTDTEIDIMIMKLIRLEEGLKRFAIDQRLN